MALLYYLFGIFYPDSVIRYRTNIQFILLALYIQKTYKYTYDKG